MLTSIFLYLGQLGCSITGIHWRHHSRWQAHTTWQPRLQRAMWCFCLWWVQMTNSGPRRSNCWRPCWSLSMLDFDLPCNKRFAFCRDMIGWSDSSNLTPACSSLYHTRSFRNTAYWVLLFWFSLDLHIKIVCCVHLNLSPRAVHFGPQNCVSSWFHRNRKNPRVHFSYRCDVAWF